VLSTGEQSAFSSTLEASALDLPNQPPLSPPNSFVAESPKVEEWRETAEYGRLYLRWCRNADPEAVTAYRVYRSPFVGGPYTEATRIATISPACLDGRRRCEIKAGQVVEEKPPCSSFAAYEATPDACCLAGVDGTCRVTDTTVAQSTSQTQRVYYYVVTAVRGTEPNVEESQYSLENQGRTNYYGSFGWSRVYDPDPMPEIICGEPLASLLRDSDADELWDGDALANSAASFAPYRVIGQIPGPPTPVAVPRFVYLHTDHLGSPRVVVDAAGTPLSTHHYMPFGKEIPSVAQQSSNRRHFTGHERDDATGLDYMLARHSLIMASRFISKDQGLGHILLPQLMNRYAYALNNPLRLVDRNGRDVTVIWIAPHVGAPSSVTGHIVTQVEPHDGRAPIAADFYDDPTGPDLHTAPFDSDHSRYNGREIRQFTIETSAEVDQQMIDLIEGLASIDLEYSAWLLDVCTTISGYVLSPTGIIVRESWPFSFYYDALYRAVMQGHQVRSPGSSGAIPSARPCTRVCDATGCETNC
jgi:RHS repeat-associated protein